jgi:deoxycytidine triphosphate deaminase
LIIANKEELKDYYPNYALTSNGIDVTIGELESLESGGKMGVNTKLLAKTKEKPLIHNYWSIRPGEACLATSEFKMRIPDGMVQTYHIRSSLARVGITMNSSVGDSGFNGKLQVLLVNNGPFSFNLERGARVFQAITHTAPNASKYDGSYNED